MDTGSILPQSHTAAPHGAHHLPGSGQAGGDARAASGHGFAVKSLDKLLGGDSGTTDEVTFSQVRVELGFDKEAHRTVITVLDPDTGDVLNQFPAENILENARHLRDLLSRQIDMKV